MNIRSFIRACFAALGALALAFGLAACTSAEAAGQQAQRYSLGDEAVLLDVRTAEEYAAGHLEGALLLDFTSGELAAAIPQLDPEAEYYVYCRSGNRSAQAMALMQQAGIENVTNLGSLEAAATATGIEVVR